VYRKRGKAMSWLPKLESAGAKVLGLAALLLSGGVELEAQVAYLKEYPTPTTQSWPLGITAGPDGALWFTEITANKIGRVTTAGVVTEFPIATANAGPYGITAGPDGALWYVGLSTIGRVTAAGVVIDYPIPNAQNVYPSITAGPDGALWFTGWALGPMIGRITTAGVVTEYPLPTQDSLSIGIAAGVDGALWFTEGWAGKIGRITTAGVITEYPVPSAGSYTSGITPGPDGALWFTDWGTGKIGRITTAGTITEYFIPTAYSEPWAITAGSDGALWFTENFYQHIGRVTTSGAITEFPLPTQLAFVSNALAFVGITTGPDGDLWFPELINDIGRLVLSVLPTPPSVSCAATQNTLWPPNDHSASVEVSGTIAAGTVALAPGGAAYAVRDEYGQVQPSGSIALGADGSYSFAVSLIAARNGNDRDGRTYTIMVNSKDTLGNVGSCSAVVTVPHDQGH
jgi:virginiamycin B lyase